MNIKNLKIIKLISSILVVTVFSIIINDYSYALTAKNISSLSTYREKTGYNKEFRNMGLTEQNAVNYNASTFVNDISQTYETQKKRIQENYENKKIEVNNNKIERIQEIMQSSQESKEKLTQTLSINKAEYAESYQTKRNEVIAEYDERLDSMNDSLATLREMSGKKRNSEVSKQKDKVTKEVDNINSDIGGKDVKEGMDAAEKSNKESKRGKVKGETGENETTTADASQITTIDTSEVKEVDSSGLEGGTSDFANYDSKVKQLEKKISALKLQKQKDLNTLEKRNDNVNAELDMNYESDIKAIDDREKGYIANLENMTNTELENLENSNQKSLDDLYENANTEINNYLFGEEGLYTRAYKYEDTSIMRDLSSVQEEGMETKTLDSTGGYIGDLQEYLGIEEQRRIYFGNQYLEKANKILSSGASDGFSQASEYAAAAGVSGKDAQVIMPANFEGTGSIGSPIELSMNEGISDGSTVDPNVITLDQASQEAKNKLLLDADKTIAETDRVISDLKKGQDSATETAETEMKETATGLAEESSAMTNREIQELLNFVYELEGYLDMVWPKEALGEYERQLEAEQEAQKAIEEQEVSVGGLIAGLVISVAMAIISFAIAITKLTTATAGVAVALVMIASGVLAICGIIALIASSAILAVAILGLITAVVSVSLLIWQIVAAYSELKQLEDTYDAVSKERQSTETALLGGLEAPTKEKDESDEEYNKRWDAMKRGADTSYGRYLQAQYDYQKAMKDFESMFYREFGIFGLKNVRAKIDAIKKLMRG
ncbi:MAG: hypothetical protein LBE97_00145, partial [Holosporales bacterium]|nr:hypothetical protein [Holosporales bacterium]